MESQGMYGDAMAVDQALKIIKKIGARMESADHRSEHMVISMLGRGIVGAIWAFDALSAYLLLQREPIIDAYCNEARAVLTPGMSTSMFWSKLTNNGDTGPLSLAFFVMSNMPEKAESDTLTVKFVEPTEHHNHFGLRAIGDPKYIRAFDMVCSTKFKERDCGAFHQGSDVDWSYWEFWHQKTPEFRREVQGWGPELLAEAVKLADELD